MVELVVLRLLLICESDAVCPLSTVLTAVLKLVFEDMAPLRLLLICDRDTV